MNLVLQVVDSLKMLLNLCWDTFGVYKKYRVGWPLLPPFCVCGEKSLCGGWKCTDITVRRRRFIAEVPHESSPNAPLQSACGEAGPRDPGRGRGVGREARYRGRLGFSDGPRSGPGAMSEPTPAEAGTAGAGTTPVAVVSHPSKTWPSVTNRTSMCWPFLPRRTCPPPRFYAPRSLLFL